MKLILKLEDSAKVSVTDKTSYSIRGFDVSKKTSRNNKLVRRIIVQNILTNCNQ